MDNTLEQGDRVLLIGSDAEIAAFDDLAKGEAVVPSGENSCQWIRIEPDSRLVHHPLNRLKQEFPEILTVQALRREGKFLRSPEMNQEICAGDRLLLCGTSEVLKAVQAWLVAQAA
jgi:monovalent cation:H+ antiporter-2, CPA2 family